MAHCPLFFILTNNGNVKTWKFCLQRGRKKANIFQVVLMASAWGSTVNSNVMFLIYPLFPTRSSPKQFPQHEASEITVFSVYWDTDDVIIVQQMFYCTHVRIICTGTTGKSNSTLLIISIKYSVSTTPSAFPSQSTVSPAFHVAICIFIHSLPFSEASDIAPSYVIFPANIRPSSPTSSSHLFLDLPLILVVLVFWSI